MRRPFEIEIELYDRKEAELIGKEEWEIEGKRVKCLIDLDEVDSVRETIVGDDEETSDKCCLIFMKSGLNYVCYNYGYEEILNILIDTDSSPFTLYNPKSTTTT